MTTLVSLVLSNADRLPIIGSPISQATTWYRARSDSQDSIATSNISETETPPPPPYEKEAVLHSKLTQLSDYVWKRANSFSGTTTFSNNSIKESTATTLVALQQKAKTLDKKKIDEGISLIQMAAEMNGIATATAAAAAAGNQQQQMSIDLYMMGLEKILASLPIDSDPIIKSSLEAKLVAFKEKNNLLLLCEGDIKPKQMSKQEQAEALGGLSSLIIDATVLCAVSLKKSPIPEIMSRMLELSKTTLIKIDQTCSIRTRTQNITSAGIAKAIELDQHYEVHQFFAEVFYTGCMAILKAGIAYNNTTKQQQQQ